jgi:hypothetical protein
MRTCQRKINGTTCGKPSYANSSDYCEDCFKYKFPVTYARFQRELDQRKKEADAYEVEMRQKRQSVFDPPPGSGDAAEPEEEKHEPSV